jgi:hypothetical protein
MNQMTSEEANAAFHAKAMEYFAANASWLDKYPHDHKWIIYRWGLDETNDPELAEYNEVVIHHFYYSVEKKMGKFGFELMLEYLDDDWAKGWRPSKMKRGQGTCCADR